MLLPLFFKVEVVVVIGLIDVTLVVSVVGSVVLSADWLSFNAYMEIGTTMALTRRRKTPTNPEIQYFFFDIIHDKFMRCK